MVFAEAYGAARLDPFEPMTVDTVVDIGSVSKQFTATAILMLAERGKVDFDAPLSTYLPDLPAWASRPTIAQLIHHQSGIPDYIDLLVDRGFTETGQQPHDRRRARCAGRRRRSALRTGHVVGVLELELLLVEPGSPGGHR